MKEGWVNEGWKEGWKEGMKNKNVIRTAMWTIIKHASEVVGREEDVYKISRFEDCRSLLSSLGRWSVEGWFGGLRLWL